MTVQSLLHRLASDICPDERTRDRMRHDVMRRIRQPQSPDLLRRVRLLLTPVPAQRRRVYMHVCARLSSPPVRTGYRFPKWVAAAALVLIAVRASPLLFLAPHSSAQSAVLLLPTRGDVLLSLHGMWQPVTEDITVTKGVNIRTGDGEATILLHDDGTVRIAPHTTVTLHDVSDRPDPGTGGATLTLTAGEIWVQGLLSTALRGIEVVTPGGSVVLHRGSVSLQATVEQSTRVRVWDRSVQVVGEQESRSVLTGDEVWLLTGVTPSASRNMSAGVYDDPWVVQNISRDAVHQREIAQMQKERRAVRAGILPGNALYPVKRVAERMDVLLTFDAAARTRKKIDHADTRLNEAAALLPGGATGALMALAEYRDALVALASGSGEDLTQVLLHRSLEETVAQLSAALPTDELYTLKRTVLETSAQLAGTFDERTVQDMLLLDTAHGLHMAIRHNDTAAMQRALETMRPALLLLDVPATEGGLSAETREELVTLLTEASVLLQEQEAAVPVSGTGTVHAMLRTTLTPFLPPSPAPLALPVFTLEEIDQEMSGILTRLNIYDLPRSRYNQLQYEMERLQGHPAEGSILRRLSRALEPELAQYVLPALQELRARLQSHDR